MTEIRHEHVSYAYGDEKILEDINLQVTSGEVVSILGPSGVGKTTLFNLIAGILEVQSGRIVLDGEENPNLVSAISACRLRIIPTQQAEPAAESSQSE